MTPTPVHLQPLTLTSTSRVEVVAALVEATAGRPPGTVVVEAALLGPRLAPERRVVEVLARADEIIAERVGTTGIVRVTRAWGVDLLDAGALDLDGAVAFPPDDPAREARALREALGGAHGMELASRAGLGGNPVGLASAGTAGHSVAGALALTDAPAVFVEGEPRTTGDGGRHGQGETLTEGTPTIDPRYDAVRAALGVATGTVEALDIGLPPLRRDDVEQRIARACRLALRPFPEVSPWHPVRRHVRTGIDPSAVDATILQIGVRLDAPDDLTLGAAIGRLVVALAAEGVTATPIQHEDGPRGCTALVAFLGDTHTAPDGT